MERKIGEIFKYKGKKLRVEADEDSECKRCYLRELCPDINQKIIGECVRIHRQDKTSVVFVEINDEHPQEINLCEILKHCAQDEQFWSPMLDGVKFLFIDEERQMIIVETIEGHFTWEINHDGTISIDEVTSPEIMLFPSRTQRDWTKVKYEPKKELPKTWEEFCKQNELREGEYFLGNCCNLMPVGGYGGTREEMRDRNILPSSEAAEAHLALMQLHQLRDAWREGWLPDWTEDNQRKYVICSLDGEFSIRIRYTNRYFLAFQDEKRAYEFKDCFIDLIRKAGDLI